MDKQKSFDAVLHAKLNLETASMQWAELERFFASGTLISVERGLDLVEVATRMANDEKAAVESWLKSGAIAKVSDAQAQTWHENNAALWTVVVKPWILVQENSSQSSGLH